MECLKERGPAPPAQPSCSYKSVRHALEQAAAERGGGNGGSEGLFRKFLEALQAITPEQNAEGVDADVDADQKRDEGILTALLAAMCLLKEQVLVLDNLLCSAIPQWGVRNGGGTEEAEDGQPPPFGVVSVEERRRALNMPLPTYLLEPLLDFVMQPALLDSLPPLLQCRPESEQRQSAQPKVGARGPAKAATRKMVMAMLDGGTPLHFAAAAGGVEQVNWLLANGADIHARTAAGETPIQLVPKCPRASQHHGCRCSREPSLCSSGSTRMAIACRGMVSLAGGVGAWMGRMLYGLLCLLGLWGCYTSIYRPEVERHAEGMDDARRLECQEQVRRQVRRMRASAREAQELLPAQRKNYGPRRVRYDQGEPGGDTAMTKRWQGKTEKVGVKIFAKDRNLGDPPDSVVETITDGNSVLDNPELDTARLLLASRECVSILESLDLTPAPSSGERQMDCPKQLLDTLAYGEDIGDCHVTPEEWIAAFMRFAEAIYVEFRARRCPADDFKKASDRMHFCVAHGARALDRMERVGAKYPGAERVVGACYVQIVHASVRLLLAGQASRSATLGALEAAEKLLKRWGDLDSKGHVANVGLAGDVHVECLEAWWRNKTADMALAVALRGRPLQPGESLAVAVEECVAQDPVGTPRLRKSVSKDVVSRLQTALDAESVALASERLVETLRGVAELAAAEVACAEELRACLRTSGAQADTREALGRLQDAIAQTARFPRLKEEAASATRTLHKRKLVAEAARKLEADLEEAREPPPPPTTPEGSREYWEAVRCKIQALTDAISLAQEASVSVGGARKVLAEMQGQVAAVEAAENLESVLESQHSNAAVLKTALQKAEAALARAGACHMGGHAEGTAALHPAMQAARRRLEVVRTTNALQRATQGCHGLGDLPRLEAAILAARKTRDVDADVLRSASELRASLDRAVKSKAGLEAAVKALSRTQRQEEASTVEEAIAQARDDASLLQEELSAAEEAVKKWQLLTASEARLAKAMRDGSNSTALARVLQDAVSAGVRETAAARKLCKAVGNLEAAMQRAREGSKYRGLLVERIAQAEAAGVAPSVLRLARALERRTLLEEAKSQLELALRPKSDRNAAAQGTALQEALETADALLASRGGVVSTKEAAVQGVNGETGTACPVGVDGPVWDVDATEAKICLALEGLGRAARAQLQEEAAEQARIEVEDAEEHRVKLEKQKAERAEREKAHKARKVEKQREEAGRAQKLRVDQTLHGRLGSDLEQEDAQRPEVVVCKMMRPQPDQATSFEAFMHSQASFELPQPSFPDSHPLQSRSKEPRADSPLSPPARVATQNGHIPAGEASEGASCLPSLAGYGVDCDSPSCRSTNPPSRPPSAPYTQGSNEAAQDLEPWRPLSPGLGLGPSLFTRTPFMDDSNAGALENLSPRSAHHPFTAELTGEECLPSRPRSAHQLFSPYPYPYPLAGQLNSSFLAGGSVGSTNQGVGLPMELYLPLQAAREGVAMSPMRSAPSPQISAEGVMAFGNPHLTAFSQPLPSAQPREGASRRLVQSEIECALPPYVPFSKTWQPPSRCNTPTLLSNTSSDHNSGREAVILGQSGVSSRVSSPFAGAPQLSNPAVQPSDAAFNFSRASNWYGDGVFEGLPSTLDDAPPAAPLPLRPLGGSQHRADTHT